jgi:hypothetical protein
MTLREYFAARVMQTMVRHVDFFANEPYEVPGPTGQQFPANKLRAQQMALIAADSYAMADAMLAARKSGGAA